MNNLEEYLIKSVLIAAIYFGFYWLFLRNRTFYKLNRIYLLLALMQAIILPFFQINIQDVPIGNFVNSTLPPLIINAEAWTVPSQNSFSIFQIFMIIYISGATFLLFRFFNNLARIMFLYFRFPKVNFNGFTAVLLQGDQSSFTFFNTLFIADKDIYNDSNEVILHEMAHRRQWHSIDIIIMELIAIFQWINPVVWLYRSALKSQHEYAADIYVLEKGHDIISYQRLLFERAVGFSPLGLTNYFNHSLLKKRLYMMTKNKSKAWHRIHYWISVPLMLITAILFIVQPKASAQDSEILMHDQVERMPEYPGGIPAIRKYITENINYPESARTAKLSAKIFTSFVVDEEGKVTNVKIERTDIVKKARDTSDLEIVVVGYIPDNNTEYNPNAITDLENEAIRVIQSLGDFEPGMNDDKHVKVQYTFPIQFILE
jgi:hypothetical protein